MSNNRKWQFWKTKPSPSQAQHTQNVATTKPQEQFSRYFKSTDFLGHLLVGVFSLSGAIATALNLGSVQLMERQTQTTFFQLRGAVKPPETIVILAIDEYSLDQGKQYRSNPDTPAEFELLESWPWKREAYAKVIDRLMQAGARSVAVDLVFDTPSSYGEADDEKLQQVLQKYAGRVTLAALYEEDETRSGGLIKLIQPDALFQTNPMSVGSINYLLDPDGRIHQFASQFPQVWAKNNPGLAKEFLEFVATVPSFEVAALQAAKLNYTPPKGNTIFFYGPPQTFEYIPFSDVLDPENWNTYLQGGKYFQDKIVLIGPTATLFQDSHRTPFSASTPSMPGVEIHASAIATLLEGRSIAPMIPNPVPQGLFVFVAVVGTGFFLSRQKRWPMCIGLAAGVAIAWGGMSYLVFINRLILPTAVPIIAITLTGLSYGAIGAIKELLSKLQLRKTFKHYSSSPIIQEIISQQDDLQDLLEERELELLATKLDGRYKLIKRLSAGGFGETYIAEDTRRPGNPQCVVKQLRPATNNPQVWHLARRLFITEAETLERLGKHDQIPQLLAYFEEAEEFYLVEEFIVGQPLIDEMPLIVPLSEDKVIAILQDILSILEFIHKQGVIHRDVKPENLIRRKSDGKLVLIDFGAVKEIRTYLEEGAQPTKFTVGLGTKGYMPNEQAIGSPKFNSDIFAAGMIAIQALAVIHPSNMQVHPKTGEVLWQDRAKVSPELTAIINKMVRSDWRDRYQSATEVLQALEPLTKVKRQNNSTSSVLTKQQPPSHLSVQDKENLTIPSDSSTPSDVQDSTQIWSDSSTPSDIQDSTQIWSDSSTPSDIQDSTQIWSDSSTPSEVEQTTQIWSDSSTPSEEEETTQIWSDSSTPSEVEQTTQIWSDSSTPSEEEQTTQIWSDSIKSRPQSPSSEPSSPN